MRFFQQTDSSSQTYKKSVLGLIAMFICAFLAVGCSSGGGGDSFVASPGGGVPAGGGGGGATAGAGSVTFNFVRAQSAIVVPTTTVQLRFEFFTGLEGTGTIIKRELRDYADTITIENVPTSVQSTVVTAITADGFPIAEFTANVTVPASGNVTVDSTDGTISPVTAVAIISSPQSVALGNADSFQLSIQVEFSNGDVVPVDLTSGVVTFSSTSPSVATVDANGNITAGLDGTAFITATLNAPGFTNVSVEIPLGVGDGVQPPPTITGIQIITPAAAGITLPRGTMSVPLVVQATFGNPPNQTTSIVTAANGVVFAVDPDNVGVTVNGSQAIVVSNDAEPGQIARVSVSFQGFQDFIDVTVSAATLQSISATPSAISLPYGGFSATIVVEGVFSDGIPRPLANSELTFTGPMTRYSLDTSNDMVSILTNAVANPPAGGTEVLTITHNTVAVPPATVDVSVGLVTVTGLTVTPSNLTGDDALVPGERVLFDVRARFSNGTTGVDVSSNPFMTVVAVQDASTAQANIATSEEPAQVVAIAPTGTGPALVRFTLLGAGASGDNFEASVNVEVQSEVVDLDAGLSYFFGGINVVDFPTGVPQGESNAVNLPRGYAGVIEVEATFSSGVTRRLRPGEYEILLGPSTDFAGGDGIYLWQTEDGIGSAADHYPVPGPATIGLYFNGLADQLLAGEFDDLYYMPRTVVPVTGPQQGSLESEVTGGTAGRAVTRRTFRAVASDWRRGETFFGQSNTGPSFAVNNANFTGGARRVIVRLDSTILPALTNPQDEDFEFSVTIVDPPGCEIDTDSAVTNFVNYKGDGRIPVNAVRELEVRANFFQTDADTLNSPDDEFGIDIGTRGPFVSEITGFKLAEANCMVISSFAGVADFARTAPTELGYLGIFSSDNTVGNNVLNVRAIPIHGDNVRSVFVGPSPTDYSYVSNNYGTASGDGDVAGFDFTEGAGGRDATTQTSDPADGAARIVDPLNEIPVQFITPFLFSVDPPTASPSTAVSLVLGNSQVFRTLVQYGSGIAPVDVSLDYPPVLFTDAASPAAVARLADPATSPGTVLGNIIVSGINPAGGTVDEADVIAANGGDDVLASAITALNSGSMNYSPTEALVVAIDAAGFPIPFRGSFGAPGNPPNQRDARNLASPSSSVSGLTIDPAP